MKTRTEAANDEILRAEPGKMLDEGQLKQEWKDHSELYQGGCYKTYDITPMLLDRVVPPDE